MCAGCWRYTELEVYQLSCCCSCRRRGHDDQRHLFAVAWICDHCDHVRRHRRRLQQMGHCPRRSAPHPQTARARRNFAVAGHLAHVHHECRRHVDNAWRLTPPKRSDPGGLDPAWLPVHEQHQPLPGARPSGSARVGNGASGKRPRRSSRPANTSSGWPTCAAVAFWRSPPSSAVNPRHVSSFSGRWRGGGEVDFCDAPRSCSTPSPTRLSASYWSS
jgi:hypothetical protein